MTRAMRKSGIDPTQGAIVSKVILFSLPLIATGVLSLLFNTADTVVVGRWGGDTPEDCEAALGAVGACGSLINLLIGLFLGLSTGAGVCVAHGIGAKLFDDVKATVHTAVIAAAIGGFAAAIAGFFAAEPLLRLMGTPDAVLSQAIPYMRAYFCGVPALLVYHLCAAMLRSAGDTVRPLIFLSIAGVANVLLNLVTVLVFRMGALGVGIATAVSQWISCILVLLFMMKSSGPCRLEYKHLRVDRAKLMRIISIGIPAGIQGTLFSLSNVLIQSSINSFENVAFIAGNTAAGNIEGYIYTAQNAIYQAALTFVGQNVGAQKFDRVKRSILACAGTVSVVGILMGIAAVLFGDALLGIYAPGNHAAIEAGVERLTIICLPYFLCGLMEVGCGALRGLGKSILPTVISLLGSCALRVVWIYTVFAMFHTPEVLFISYPITWFLTASTHFLISFLLLRKIRKTAKPLPVV